MNTYKKISIGILGTGIVTAGVVLYFASPFRYVASEPPPASLSSDTTSPTPSVSPTPELPRISDIQITPPAGWYAHKMSDYSVLYTKQQQLPSISADGTDAFHYGEEIRVWVSHQERTMEEWEERNLINNPMTLSKSWTTLQGHKLLKTKHITPSADAITYYLFIDGRVYSFFLYPADSQQDPQTHEPRPNTKGIAALEQIMESYLPHLK